MIKRIGALVFIFVCTTIAWLILGTTIVSRSYSPLSDQLKSRVASNWGTAQEQAPPTATYKRESISYEGNANDPKQISRTHAVPLVLEATKVDATLDLEHRQKGLLWYSTYTVLFAGSYDFTNFSGQDQDVTFELGFPSKQAVYDDLLMSVDD